MYVVDSLYEIYRSNTPNSLAEAEIKAIKADKKKYKIKRSDWLSHVKKDNTPFEKEFRSIYEKEYLEWRKEIQPFINNKGFIDLPTEKEIEANFENKAKTKPVSFFMRLFKPRAPATAVTSSIYDSESIPYQSTFTGWNYYGPIQVLSNNGQPNVTNQANVRAFAQSPTNPDYLVCGVDNGTLYISHSKGKMWHLATKNYDIKGLTAVSFSASDENTIFAGSSPRWNNNGGRLYFTNDGGVTWTDITNSSGFGSFSHLGGPGNAFSKILSVSIDGNPSNDVVLMATSKGLSKLHH